MTAAGEKRRVILYGGRHFRKGWIDKREGRGRERTRCDKGKGRSQDGTPGGGGRGEVRRGGRRKWKEQGGYQKLLFYFVPLLPIIPSAPPHPTPKDCAEGGITQRKAPLRLRVLSRGRNSQRLDEVR